VTWTWDLGRTTARTSGITNAYGKAYSTTQGNGSDFAIYRAYL